MDREAYRYQIFMSDIVGQDIRAHNFKVQDLIKIVRNWLSDAQAGEVTILGAAEMIRRFNEFKGDLPKMGQLVKKNVNELTFIDRSILISEWLQEKP